jgi:hypothetical protein
MRSGIHGTFATLLLMVPLLSIPALAIFGIPQFAPVVASPLDEGPKQDRERRVGQSARHSDDAMLGDLDDAPAFASEMDDNRREPGSGPGRVGDSVSLSRSGRGGNDRNFGDRNSSDRISPFDQNSARDQAPASRWDDEKSEDPRRAGGFGDSASFDRTNDRAAGEFPDPRSGSNSPSNDFRPPRFQRTSMPMTDPTAAPRAFQRQKDPQAPVESSLPATSASEPLTWQSAVRRLNELEIRNFRLQPGSRDQQFVFICSYTPSDSPRVSYRFEAEADEPLKAVEKVLEQIVEWQQRR